MGLSAENAHLEQYLTDSGVTFVVIATTGTYVSPQDPCHPHAPGSYHCKPGTGAPGLAVDVAERVGGGSDTPGLLAIRNAIHAVDHLSAEVIYAGPGAPPCIKNGQPFTYDSQTMAGHHNHCHWAVEKGVLVQFAKVAPMYSPPVAVAPIVADVYVDGKGYLQLSEDGYVHPWLGATAPGQPPNDPRVAKGQHWARIEADQNGYTCVTVTGNRYGYGW